MSQRSGLFLFGVLVGAAAAAGAAIYRRRPLERIPSPESVDDPAVAAGYGWVAKTPQMQLLRLLVARRAVELAPRGVAIDLGCGPGWLVLDLARQAPELHVIGVDLSDEMLAQAEANAREAGLAVGISPAAPRGASTDESATRVSFRRGDARQIPFGNRSLDLVVSTLSLHHWGEPLAVLDEIGRVLRPGGAFLIFDLRRDMPAPGYLLLWIAQHLVVPAAVRRASEPLSSRNAAYTPDEVADLAGRSALAGGRVSAGPFWWVLEGHTLAQ